MNYDSDDAFRTGISRVSPVPEEYPPFVFPSSGCPTENVSGTGADILDTGVASDEGTQPVVLRSYQTEHQETKKYTRATEGPEPLPRSTEWHSAVKAYESPDYQNESDANHPRVVKIGKYEFPFGTVESTRPYSAENVPQGGFFDQSEPVEEARTATATVRGDFAWNRPDLTTPIAVESYDASLGPDNLTLGTAYPKGNIVEIVGISKGVDDGAYGATAKDNVMGALQSLPLTRDADFERNIVEFEAADRAARTYDARIGLEVADAGRYIPYSVPVSETATLDTEEEAPAENRLSVYPTGDTPEGSTKKNGSSSDVPALVKNNLDSLSKEATTNDEENSESRVRSDELRYENFQSVIADLADPSKKSKTSIAYDSFVPRDANHTDYLNPVYYNEEYSVRLVDDYDLSAIMYEHWEESSTTVPQTMKTFWTHSPRGFLLCVDEQGKNAILPSSSGRHFTQTRRKGTSIV